MEKELGEGQEYSNCDYVKKKSQRGSHIYYEFNKHWQFKYKLMYLKNAVIMFANNINVYKDIVKYQNSSLLFYLPINLKRI